MYIVAVLLSDLYTLSSTMDFTALCEQETTYFASCPAYLSQTISFVQAHMLPLPPTVVAAMLSANSLVQSLGIEIMMYTYRNATAPLSLERIKILAPTEPDFAFFAWLYLYEWVLGAREVISFEGDASSLALLTDLQAPLLQPTQAWQVTANVAQYLRNGVLYVTSLVIGMTFIVIIYMISGGGHYEGRNLLKLGRVGGIVWVGRPLLLLRSMTALCVLSTATLELQYSSNISYLSTSPTPWYKTLLAANEVTWLASIINDITLVVTQEYSPYYVTLNGIVVSIIVAVVTAVAPVVAKTAIDLQCSIAEMDFQVVCTAGTIEIGHMARLQVLIGIVLVCNSVSFGVVKLVLGAKPSDAASSLFLSAGAKYLFSNSRRLHKGVYYLDRASAALNGILSVRYGKHIYALDLKIWRTFVIPVPMLVDEPEANDMIETYRAAIPLVLD
ncbi:hypothetical protein ACHHYP_06214 [Achlya hypogyna]|uniref:Transmembrane protein n=1 Tax=Achlya hypogyna TaxID=1202772 RepID=A0A1V9YV49_ACHHY|nr:hypothetical protein ACHHYP_06214 [Achlya hypogyna]